MLIINKILITNEFSSIEDSNELTKKFVKPKTKKLLKTRKLSKSQKSKSEKLAKAKKLSKNRTLSKFNTKKVGSSFLTSNAKTAFNHL